MRFSLSPTHLFFSIKALTVSSLDGHHSSAEAAGSTIRRATSICVVFPTPSIPLTSAALPCLCASITYCWFQQPVQQQPVCHSATASTPDTRNSNIRLGYIDDTHEPILSASAQHRPKATVNTSDTIPVQRRIAAPAVVCSSSASLSHSLTMSQMCLSVSE